MSEFKSLDEDIMLFAVPKKGRLYERVLKVLGGAGLDYTRLPRLDIAHVKALPIALVFLPAHDIAEYVAQGKCDLGITGQDIICEADVEVKTLLEFGFGKCKLCVLAPKGTFKDGKATSGKRIVTSFPCLARKYFDTIDDEKEQTKIKYVTGSVEVACSLGIADAVVDLVETGTTMKAAGLEIVETIMDSQTVLITKKEPLPEWKQNLINKIQARIEGYLTSTKHVMIAYNCPLDKVEACVAITPGKQGPTVSTITSVDGIEWRSIQSLIPTKDVSEIMDKIADHGGRSILIFGLNNCRFPVKQ